MYAIRSYYALVICLGILGLGLGMVAPGFTAGASLAVGPEEQGAVGGLIVITSYSIHYTKLYEPRTLTWTPSDRSARGRGWIRAPRIDEERCAR